jgi:hypothetical protein
MSAKNLTLTIDVSSQRLIRDFFSNLEIVPRALIQGDTYNVQVIAVEPNPLGDATRFWRYVTLPTSVYVGVGTPGASPTLGTFTITFGANTTSALAYNASASTVSTALNLLASIVSAGGCSVTGNDGGPYQVTFTSAGARAAFTGNTDSLYPLCSMSVFDARTGTGSLTSIQVISIDRQPAALAQTFAAIASPSVTVSTVQAGASGVPEIQKVALTSTVHDGTFTLTFSGQTTAALAWNITAADLQTYLEALSNIASGDIEVTGQFPEWTVTFKGTLTGNQPEMTGTATGLIGPVGVEGALQLSTAGIEQLVDGETSVSTYIEVTAQIDGSPTTLLQSQVTVKNDQIPSAPAAGAALVDYITSSEAAALYATLGNVPDSGLTATGTGIIARTASGVGALSLIAPATAITDASTSASTSHALNSTFSDTEVEAALNALATIINANAAKFNTLLTNLETAMILTP